MKKMLMMYVIMVITMFFTVNNSNAFMNPDMPFDLKIGMDRFEAEKKITLIQGTSSYRGKSYTNWETYSKTEQYDQCATLEQNIISVDFISNKISVYNENRIFGVSIVKGNEIPSNIQNEIKEWYKVNMGDLKGSINESNQWTLEAGDEEANVYKYKWNGTIKRLILFKREQNSLDGTNTLKLTISDVFTKYTE